ncbi:MAG: MFS transporter, partial [Clostridia bacterium]|nr:MFS transporter [Clostridia bacterium]
FLAWLAYLISYLGRSDYSACMLTILTETGAARATAGMVSSVFALFNAVGQVVSGFIVKKYSPVRVIGVELFTVALINLFFPIADSFVIMALLWGINGAMQSTLLCGTTQIFAHTLREPYLSRGVVLLNTIGAVGGMFNYLLSWFLIRFANWQSVFFTVSTLLFVLGLLWCVFMPKLTKTEPAAAAASETKKSAPALSIGKQLTLYGTVYVILGAFFVGLLRESVSLWIPSYMNEVFGFSNSLSTILTVFVPCLQACGALLGGRIGRSVRNLHYPAGAAFTLSAVCLLLIRLCGSANVVLTILLFVINAICMTGALTFLLSLFPIRYFGKGQVAVLVGIINFSVHMGDFLASSGIGWFSQISGWNVTFVILSSAALLAAVLCIAGGYVCQKQDTKSGEPFGT